MKNAVTLLILTAMLCAQEAQTSSASQRESLRLTVYNSNRALIEETRTLTLSKGIGVLNFEDVSSQIEPQTLIVQGKGFSILEQNFEYDLIDQNKLMEKFVGQEITLVNENSKTGKSDTTMATLLSFNNYQPVYKIGDRIFLSLPGRAILDKLPSNLYAKPTMRWMISSPGGVQKVTASYLTRGLTWSADYVLKVDNSDTKASLVGWVTLTNTSGTAYEKAQLALLAGTVNEATNYPRGRSLEKMAMYSDSYLGSVPPAPMQEQSVDEYHLYTLPRTTSIMNNQTKQVELLAAEEITVKKNFIVPGANWGPEEEGKTKLPVEIQLSFQTGKKNNLDLALPAGVIRLYKEHEGNQLFLGEDAITHTPKDETIYLKTGEAFDLVALKRETNRTRETKREEVTTEVTLKNKKETPVTIFYDAPTYSGDWKIKCERPYKELNHQKVRFEITVPAKSEVVFPYTLTMTWK